MTNTQPPDLPVSPRPMNLKEKVGKTFSNFWNINIGHVTVLLTVLFGWGMLWQKTQDRIEAVALVAEHQGNDNRTALATAIAERNLRLDALAARLARDETDITVVSDLKTQVAVIAQEFEQLNRQISSLRQELKEQAVARNGRGD